ncbi:MAG: cobaltochelatase subunit CobN [Phascolarctobacterium sp.]|nr:cobaltochelatase subunit CobN [Phascolarctobacterium sp.]
MKKILIITNMESDRVGMLQAVKLIEKTYPNALFDVVQTNDMEIWSNRWEKMISDTDFFLCTWMGTGLSCDFLKRASAFLIKNKQKHLFKIADPGNDVLDYGITKEEKESIYKYFSGGGLVNYKSLCLWLMRTFQGMDVDVPAPVELPWHGIYHPDYKKHFASTKEYYETHCDPSKPTLGFAFYREDWLWGRLTFQNAIIRTMEKHGMNIIPVFTTNMKNPMGQGVYLRETFKKFFYLDGLPVVDVLLNPFVFSLTTTGFLKIEDLQSLGVPVLQLVNMYQDYNFWDNSTVGLTANEVAYAVAMPEFDGTLHAVPTSTQETAEDGTHYRKVLPDRIDMLARKAWKWAQLQRKENAEKKIAIVFHNYPPTNSNIGSAACLDSLESVRLLLARMKKQGYSVDHIPKDAQSFIEEVTAHATNDRRFISETLLESADGKLTEEDYKKLFYSLPQKTQDQLLRDWGEAPGEVFRYEDVLIVPGMLNGNIFITVQPPRGFGDDPGKIYHDPDCAPTHHYVGFYYWLRDVWQADAMMHIGTHGNLEWLPGKGNAMSNACYPDVCTGDMPNVYPYWITCVGEGIQAKRRSAACLISYLSAPMSVSGTYEELEELEKLLDEYIHFKNDDNAQANLDGIQNMIRDKAHECNLDEDVPETECTDFDDYMGKLHIYMTDIKNMQMSIGLHVLGVPPEGDELTEYMLALTKLDNGKVPSLTKTLANMHGYEYYELLEHSANMLPDKSKTYGMLVDEIRKESLDVIQLLQEHHYDKKFIKDVYRFTWTKLLKEEDKKNFEEVLVYVCEQIAPNILQTTLELDNSMNALDGAYIDPCPSGAPTSGGADLLPTGRNFYSVDPRTLPTKVAWEIGRQMGDDVIERFIREEGHYPEACGIILWATSNLRNHGQCVAEFLYLMGIRPVWQPGSLRVIGLEVIPLDELRRPRVDVTGRISGLFRDSMPASVTWLDEAVKLVSELDEPLDMNFVRKHVLEETEELEKEGMDKKTAWRQASFRIFGDPPGAHGAGTGYVLEAKNWETVEDIAAVYTRWGAHAYGEGSEGKYLPTQFKRRMSQLDVTIQNVDHRESSMLSGDDYNNYRGGFVAAVRAYKGSMPRNYVSDSSDRSKVQLRSLTEELKRWFRGEAINPKYINGMKKHGYAGAGELATYVAVSYQWDATSAVMEDWMYEKYAQKYALDPEIKKWMQEVNPWALHRITEVLLEAEQRKLWNAEPETKKELEKLFLEMEGELEEKTD